jgi:large subunit ribosomal protein L23
MESGTMHQYEVIKRPVITEKSNLQTDAYHRYTFEVDVRANKIQVAQAVAAIFKVTVLDVNIMNVRGKSRRVGRSMGKTPNWKKAIVTLAPGSSISFIES